MTGPTSEGNAVLRAFDLQVDEKNRIKDVNEKGKTTLTVEEGNKYPYDISIKDGKLTTIFKDDGYKERYAKKIRELIEYGKRKEMENKKVDREIDD